eukprot:277163_1
MDNFNHMISYPQIKSIENDLYIANTEAISTFNSKVIESELEIQSDWESIDGMCSKCACLTQLDNTYITNTYNNQYEDNITETLNENTIKQQQLKTLSFPSKTSQLQSLLHETESCASSSAANCIFIPLPDDNNKNHTDLFDQQLVHIMQTHIYQLTIENLQLKQKLDISNSILKTICKKIIEFTFV